MAGRPPGTLFAANKTTAQAVFPYADDVLLATKDGEYGDTECREAEVGYDGSPVDDGDYGEGKTGEDIESKENDAHGQLEIHARASEGSLGLGGRRGATAVFV
jgi:uncharacterized low-complexity protein